MALVDTSHEKFQDLYTAALTKELDLSTLDYLIVSHTEPDHSGSSIQGVLYRHFFRTTPPPKRKASMNLFGRRTVIFSNQGVEKNHPPKPPTKQGLGMIHKPSSKKTDRGLIGKVLEMAKEAGNEKLEVIGSKMCIAYLENLVFVSWPLKVDGRWPWERWGKVALERGGQGPRLGGGLEVVGSWNFSPTGKKHFWKGGWRQVFILVHFLGK